MFGMIHDVMSELIELRRRLLSAALTQGQMAELKSKIASKIDWGNKYADFYNCFFTYSYNFFISWLRFLADYIKLIGWLILWLWNCFSGRDFLETTKHPEMKLSIQL